MKRTIENSLGFRIERLRRYLRVSHTCIANLIFEPKRSRQYVSEIEHDEKSITVDELKRLAVLFCLPGYDYQYLLDVEKYKTIACFKLPDEIIS